MGVGRGSEWEGSGKRQLESSADRMEVDGDSPCDLEPASDRPSDTNLWLKPLAGYG